MPDPPFVSVAPAHTPSRAERDAGTAADHEPDPEPVAVDMDMDMDRHESFSNPILDGIKGINGSVLYAMGLTGKHAAASAAKNAAAADILPARTKIGYGVGDLAGNLFYTIIEFWLMYFFTDVAKLDAFAAGGAILVGKLFDAFADPLTGWLSDRTRSKWGRRRPWMLYGAIPLALCTFLLFSNVYASWTPAAQVVWATFVYILGTVANTAVNIPYCALTPELSSNFDERTSLTSYRMAFAAVATLIGAALTLEIVKLMPTRTGGFMFMGALFGVIMAVSTLIAFKSVKEKLFHPVDHSNPFRQYWSALTDNMPYLILLIVWILVNLAITIVTTILPYYFNYVQLDEDKMSIAVAVMIVTALLFIPLTNYLSARFGKRNTYAGGLTLFSLATMVVFAFGHQINTPTKEWDGNFYFTLAMMVPAGLGFSTQYVLPWAMIPDTIEVDFARTGKKREGVYYAIWNFTITAAAAVAALFVGGILSAFGYVAGKPQSASSQLGIRLLVGPLSAVFVVAAVVVLYFYPIDKESHAKTRAEIVEMESRSANIEH